MDAYEHEWYAQRLFPDGYTTVRQSDEQQHGKHDSQQDGRKKPAFRTKHDVGTGWESDCYSSRCEQAGRGPCLARFGSGHRAETAAQGRAARCDIIFF